MQPNNNEQQQGKNEQPSPEEQLRHDEYLENVGASTLNKKHGGELVEAISLDDLVTVSDPSSCDHKWEYDPDETLGVAVRCTRPNCGIIKIASINDEE